MEWDRDGDVDRRELLKRAGVGVGIAGLFGVGYYAAADRTPVPNPTDSGTPTTDAGTPPTERTSTAVPTESPTPTEAWVANVPHAAAFQTVVNVTAAGFEPGGEEPVTELLEDPDDGTLFAFEPGTYPIERLQVDADHVGIVNTGADPVWFVPAQEACMGNLPFVFFEGVADLVLEGVGFDLRNVDNGGPLFCYLEGDSTIRDVTYLGNCHNQRAVARIEVRDPEGSARVERFVARNVQENNNLTGIYVGADHAGELVFQDCALDRFADNGVYASRPGGPDGSDGPVHVVGGTYRNNNVANVRLGSSGSRAEDVTIVVDSETPGWGGLNARGIRLRNRSGQVVADCDITFGPEAAESFGAIVFHSANGGGTVRDTDIQIDRAEIPAINAIPPEEAAAGTVTVEGVSITGSAGGGLTTIVEGRDETVFRECTVEQPNRRGLYFWDAEDCRIVDSEITVDTEPVVAEESSVTIENTRVETADGEATIDSRRLENESLSL